LPLFISLMRLTQRGLDELHNSPERGRISKERVEKLGGRSIGLYATMGPYDFVQIFEMPDEKRMMEYVLTARRDGYVEPLILPAFDTDSWSAIVNAVAMPLTPATRG
jgi:uncharacterized protein with GYD domain